MLHGLEACHTPWCHPFGFEAFSNLGSEATCRSGCKDFGLWFGKAGKPWSFASRCQAFFRLAPAAGATASGEDQPKQLQFDHAPATTTKFPLPTPKPSDGLDLWMPSAPFAYLSGIGSCWYMSPARWCGFAATSRNVGVPQPELRMCNVPTGNVWLERLQTQDRLGVSKVTPASGAVQGAAVGMQVADGVYFEVQIKKVCRLPCYRLAQTWQLGLR